MAKKKRRKQKQSVPEAVGASQADAVVTSSSRGRNEAVSEASPSASHRVVNAPTQISPSRRAFLSSSGKIVTGICGAVACIGGIRLASPNFDDTHEARFAIGYLADFKMNTLTWIREKGLFVMRDAAGIGAFSSKCTHLGCTVQRTDTGFLCPCHGARFDEMGVVVHGPAAKPLPWYRVFLYPDGRLWVHLDEQAPSEGPSALIRLGQG